MQLLSLNDDMIVAIMDYLDYKPLARFCNQTKRLIQLYYKFIYPKRNNIKKFLNYNLLNSKFEDFKYLINLGADVNAKDIIFGNTILLNAINNSDTAVVNYILEFKLNPLIFELSNLKLTYQPDINIINKQNKTGLILALEKNDYRMIELLIKKGADVNLYDQIYYSRYSIRSFELLIKYIRPENFDIKKMLILSINDNNIKMIIHLFVKYNLDPNIRFYNNNTLLHYTYKNHYLTKICLEKGTNPNLKNNLNVSPLYDINNIETIKLFLSYGADFKSPNNIGISPYITYTEDIKNIIDTY